MNVLPLTSSHRPHDPRHDVQSAWLSLLLVPIAFLGAFAVGEGLMSAMGYRVGFDTPPYWAGLLATTPALLVFAVPAVVGTHFARRAGRGGHRAGWIPAGIMIALTVFFTVLNFVPMGQ